jgi:hypothetical protein
MMSEFSPFEPEVEKEGILSKLGGGAGGSKNWRDRYFVLTDHLYYYDSKQEYSQNPQNPLGRVNLLSYYVAKSDDASFEFCVHAYPKVRAPPPLCAPHPRAARRQKADWADRNSSSPPPPPFPPSPPSPVLPSYLTPLPPCTLFPLPWQSLTCRASSKAELDDWIAAIMAPLERLKSPNAAEGSGKKKKKKQKKASGGGGGAQSEEEDQ